MTDSTDMDCFLFADKQTMDRQIGDVDECRETQSLRAFCTPLHALAFAESPILYGVALRGHMSDPRGRAECYASRLEYVWRIDASALLGEYARQCALDVLHMWDAPDVVREYLETGRPPSVRMAAHEAANCREYAVDAKARRAMASASWATEPLLGRDGVEVHEASWAASCEALNAHAAFWYELNPESHPGSIVAASSANLAVWDRQNEWLEKLISEFAPWTAPRIGDEIR